MENAYLNTEIMVKIQIIKLMYYQNFVLFQVYEDN